MKFSTRLMKFNLDSVGNERKKLKEKIAATLWIKEPM
jgi:hypothetical protein